MNNYWFDVFLKVIATYQPYLCIGYMWMYMIPYIAKPQRHFNTHYINSCVLTSRSKIRNQSLVVRFCFPPTDSPLHQSIKRLTLFTNCPCIQCCKFYGQSFDFSVSYIKTSIYKTSHLLPNGWKLSKLSMTMDFIKSFTNICTCDDVMTCINQPFGGNPPVTGGSPEDSLHKELVM